MSDETDEGRPKDPQSAHEAAGSVFKRAQHPVSTGGEERDRGRSASAKEIPGEVLKRGSMGPDVPAKVRPARKVGRRKPLTDAAADAQEAMFTRPPDDDGTHAVPIEAFDVEHDPAQVDPREDKFAEFQVSLLFALTALASIAFVVFYVTIDQKTALGRNTN